MKGTGRIKRIILMITFLIAVVILSSCVQRNTTEKAASEKVVTDSTVVSTQKSTPTPSPTKKPTPKPTPKPTSKPTPTGTPTPSPTATPAPVTAEQSVYIQREVSSDGRLFEDGYYAVLSGEGGYYNIYDCFGIYVDTFFFIEGYSTSPREIMTERELSVFYRPNTEDMKDIGVNKGLYKYSKMIPNENGFYRVRRGESERSIILYNPAGETIQTLIYSYNPDDDNDWAYAEVFCIGEETIVCFTTGCEKLIFYFVAPDGTINNQYTFEGRLEDGTYQGYPEQILGRDYYIQQGAIYDLSGKVVMNKVNAIYEFSEPLSGYDGYVYLTLSDYFIKEGKTYDLSLQPVARNTRDKKGNLIYGVEYDVDGIVCQAIHDKKNYHQNFYFEEEELVAVGYGTNQIAVLDNDNSYSFALEPGYQFDGMNKRILLLRNKDNGIVKVISLETGELINTIYNSSKDEIQNILIADEYIIVNKIWRPIGQKEKQGSYIIDKEGNVRYFTENAYIEGTIGEYILIERGPYYGIADLNGEWILKSLAWEINNDTEYSYGESYY